ncbi:MAG TPA: FtsQ-type POTRA domain-containing protein [Terracidiphilus sp.]|nr:FtsQ-type POTRA domain-containing protein [Terracidiphilus sp.]
MPLDVDDEGDERSAGNRRGRFDEPRLPWWKPAGKLGRAVWIAAACFILCGVAWAYHAGKSFLEHDARFRIAGSSDIQATGLSVLTHADLMPVFGEDVGRNVFYVPLALRRQQLEKLPWVQQATVMRVLPDRIRVAVVERQPVAFARDGQQFGLVDADGVLLNMPVAMMTQRHYSFPVLTGIDDRDSSEARKERMDVYLRMKQQLTANGAHDLDRISEIDLTDPENARVLMQEQGSDVLADFGKDNFLERFQRYQANIKDWRQQYPNLREVDLRYDHQVVLEMKHGAASASSTVAGLTGLAKADSAPAASAQAKADSAPAKSAQHAKLTRTAASKPASKRATSKRATSKRAASHPSTSKRPAKHARSSKTHHAQLKHVRHRAEARRKTTRRTRRQSNEAGAARTRTEQGQ